MLLTLGAGGCTCQMARTCAQFFDDHSACGRPWALCSSAGSSAVLERAQMAQGPDGPGRVTYIVLNVKGDVREARCATEAHSQLHPVLCLGREAWWLVAGLCAASRSLGS